MNDEYEGKIRISPPIFNMTQNDYLRDSGCLQYKIGTDFSPREGKVCACIWWYEDDTFIEYKTRWDKRKR